MNALFRVARFLAGATLLALYANLAGAQAYKPLDRPACRLYTICSKPIQMTSEDIRRLALNFEFLRDKRERFGYAAYLMAVEKGGKTMMGTYAFYRQGDKRLVKVHPQYYYPISDPVETVKPDEIDKYLIKGSHVYRRHFTNGVVLLNVSPEDAKGVDLGQDYLDPDTGKITRTIDMPKASGKILLNKPQ